MTWVGHQTWHLETAHAKLTNTKRALEKYTHYIEKVIQEKHLEKKKAY